MSVPAIRSMEKTVIRSNTISSGSSVIVDEYRRPKLFYETVKRIFRGLDTYVN